jgi:hypothetical protein
MKKLLVMAVMACVAALATGCASADYAKYADTHIEKSKTEATRYDALDSVARNSTDPTVKVAAAMALAFAGVGQQSNGMGIAPPQNLFLESLKALGGVGTSVYGLWSGNYRATIDASRGAIDPDVANKGLDVLVPKFGTQ